MLLGTSTTIVKRVSSSTGQPTNYLVSVTVTSVIVWILVGQLEVMCFYYMGVRSVGALSFKGQSATVRQRQKSGLSMLVLSRRNGFAGWSVTLPALQISKLFRRLFIVIIELLRCGPETHTIMLDKNILIGRTYLYGS